MTRTPILLSFEEYLNYDDGTDRRYELEDGRLIPMTLSPIHIAIARFLFRQLDREIADRELDREVFWDMGVRTGVSKSRLPDITVVEGEQWRSLRRSASVAVLEVPSLLAVEIVSPGEENRNRDYSAKRTEYEERGIKEYWIVDPIENKVTVLNLVGGLYKETVFTGNQRIVSRVFPELVLTAEQILSA